jgi:ATP-binding cassette, subfamily B, bacterial
MHHGGGGGAGSAVRSFQRDSSVVSAQLAPDTRRRIARFARPYSAWIAAFLVTVVIDSVALVVTPLLFGYLVQHGIVDKDPRVVTVVAIIVGLVAVLDTGVNLIGRYYSAKIGEGLIYDMRTKVFSHVQRMPIAFFTRTQTGALISRLNNDVIGAQQAFTSTLSGVVSNVLSLVLAAIAMFFLSWPITLITLILLPLFLLPAKWAGRRLHALTSEAANVNASMSTVMTERFNVSGALLVKLFGRPNEEDSNFSAKAGRVRDIGVQIALNNRFFFAGLTLVTALATALVYGIGGHLVISAAITLGTLTALAGLLARLYGPITSLVNVRVDVMSALVSFERVFEVLDLEPMIKETEDPFTLASGPASIEFDHVGFRYPTADEVSLASLESLASLNASAGSPVLHEVSFRIEPGQMVALVGPSGAGKTTITSLVSRLYDVTSGAVRVGGHDVRDVSLASLHATIGVVTQDSHMFHETMRENLLYARPGANEAELLEACASAQIAELIDSLPDGLDTVVGERGYRLSGGEKQRLAIARLLLKAPGVVVLDEATAHLDSESEVAVQRALAEALIGRTSLVIAHRLSTVRNADVILVVDDGQIVQRGRHDELLATGGLYSELYETQFAPGARDDEDLPVRGEALRGLSQSDAGVGATARG